MQNVSSQLVKVLSFAAIALIAIAVSLSFHFWRHSKRGSAAEVAVNVPGADTTARSAVELKHDFGLVMCGTRNRHTFTISNDDVKAWTVKTVSSHCSCSVVDASLPVIHPGETGEFAFQYRAPASPKNHTGSVQLEFVEEFAPKIVLSVSAMVREPLTPSSGELRFEMPRSGEDTRELRVDNFTGSSWLDIDIVDLPSWLGIERVRSIPVGYPHTQSWLIRFRGHSCSGDGFQSHMITIRAVAEQLEPESSPPPESFVRVTRIIAEDHILTPSSLMFGPMTRGNPKQASIILQSKTTSYDNVDQFFVGDSHSPECSDLAITLTRRSPQVIVIEGEYTPHGDPGIVDGTINLTLPSGRLITLPFSGRIVDTEH